MPHPAGDRHAMPYDDLTNRDPTAPEHRLPTGHRQHHRRVGEFATESRLCPTGVEDPAPDEALT
ncbi:hypothetical protein [Streptomyces cyanogenus]|uniref:Uncharacterized protein n=1 Tax=Streptomyces cyanogenus TaxID=80860 RepID=A0ABX7U3Q9_STRCY|nr:hypothetical protein [Streptomyces cyanogenus]QTE02819.1 hypothetical protein S1361_36135 [Streptomyces cyanogenus]